MAQQGSNLLLIGGGVALTGILSVPMAIVFFLGGMGADDEEALCEDPATAGGGAAAPSQTVSVDPDTLPDGDVAGYSGEQLENAALIILAAEDMGLTGRDQAIGVMTAIGESTLENIDYGDDVHGVTNPDGTATTSLGLFQQQDNWGSADDRMDPYTSAQLFFEELEGVHDRDNLEPTRAAHAVQGNAVADHYAQHWDDAVEVLEALSDSPLDYDDSGSGTTQASGTDGPECPGGGGQQDYSGEISEDGWAFPTEDNTVTSFYGMRNHPIMDTCRLHAGVDIDGQEGDPLYAAYDATATSISYDPSGGWMLSLDMADDSGQLRYLHIHESAGSANIFVEVGDEVEAGEHIAELGNTGISTGAHAHFEIHDSDGPQDPMPILEDAGFEFNVLPTAGDLIVSSC